jgi:hypothetical protein
MHLIFIFASTILTSHPQMVHKNGTQQLVQSTYRMDIKACLIPTPPTPGEAEYTRDGAAPNYGWKTVAQLHPSTSIAAVVSIDWTTPGIPYAVVLMVSAVAPDSISPPIQQVLEDNGASAAPIGGGGFGANTGGFGSSNGGGGGGGGGSAQQQHVATLPSTLVSAFIGKSGSNVKALCSKYGRNCKINVDKVSGQVMVSGCSDQNMPTLYNEIQQFISSGGASAAGGGNGGGGFGGGNGGGGFGGGNGGGGFGGGGGSGFGGNGGGRGRRR